MNASNNDFKQVHFCIHQTSRSVFYSTELLSLNTCSSNFCSCLFTLDRPGLTPLVKPTEISADLPKQWVLTFISENSVN